MTRLEPELGEHILVPYVMVKTGGTRVDQGKGTVADYQGRGGQASRDWGSRF